MHLNFEEKKWVKHLFLFTPSDENLFISTPRVWFCSTEMHLFTSSYVKSASNSHRFTSNRRKSLRNYEKCKGNCAQSEERRIPRTDGLSQITLSGGKPLTCFHPPPTQNPSARSNPPRHTDRQSSRITQRSSRICLCVFYVQTTWITVKQQLKKKLMNVTHLSWQLGLVGKVFPLQTMDTGSLEWST